MRKRAGKIPALQLVKNHLNLELRQLNLAVRQIL